MSLADFKSDLSWTNLKLSSSATWPFFEGKSYTSAAVNSHLKRAKIGKSQCRKVRGKNTRVTYLYQTAFDQESLDIIVKGKKEIL